MPQSPHTLRWVRVQWYGGHMTGVQHSPEACQFFAPKEHATRFRLCTYLLALQLKNTATGRETRSKQASIGHHGIPNVGQQPQRHVQANASPRHTLRPARRELCVQTAQYRKRTASYSVDESIAHQLVSARVHMFSTEAAEMYWPYLIQHHADSASTVPNAMARTSSCSDSSAWPYTGMLCRLM